MNLTRLLSNKKITNSQNIPLEKWAIMERSTNELKDASLSSNAIQKGDVLPIFNLPNVNGKVVKLTDYQADFLVISFYRGGWCPFCNLELRALQNILPQLKALNTELVAISPETPDHSLTTSEKNELSYDVLSDLNNEYAKSLGLVFELPEDLRTVYKSFDINVEKHNGNKEYELPMPATYVINKQREIIYSFVPEDYTERLDPSVIIDTLTTASIDNPLHTTTA